MSTAEIPRRFLDFFAERGHTVVAGTPLPTMLFVNAGMVPFEPHRTGEAPAPWPRATRLKATDRENQRLRDQATRAHAAELAATALEVGGVGAATATTAGGADAACALATAVRDLLPAERAGVVAVGTVSDGGSVVVTAVNDSGRASGRDASALVRRLLDGRGGGSPELAQGGSLSADHMAETLVALPGLVADV